MGIINACKVFWGKIPLLFRSIVFYLTDCIFLGLVFFSKSQSFFSGGNSRKHLRRFLLVEFIFIYG